MAKHRLGHVYCHIPDVVDLYLKRWREDDWDEADERDGKEFLKLEKKIYLEKYPQNNGIFHGEREAEEEEEGLNKDEVEYVGSTGTSKPSVRTAKGKAAKGKAAKGKTAQKKKATKKRRAAKKTETEEELELDPEDPWGVGDDKTGC